MCISCHCTNIKLNFKPQNIVTNIKKASLRYSKLIKDKLHMVKMEHHLTMAAVVHMAAFSYMKANGKQGNSVGPQPTT